MKMGSAGLASIFSNGYRSLSAPVSLLRMLASTGASSLPKHNRNNRKSTVLSCLSSSKRELSCLSSRVDIGILLKQLLLLLLMAILNIIGCFHVPHKMARQELNT